MLLPFLNVSVEKFPMGFNRNFLDSVVKPMTTLPPEYVEIQVVSTFTGNLDVNSIDFSKDVDHYKF